MFKNLVLCLINTMLMASGQILFKLGSNGKKLDSFLSMVQLLFSPIILVALCLYAFTTMLWLYILSKVDISFAYPVQALAFPVVLIVSSLLFKEAIPTTRWIGVGIILIGVFIAVK